MKTNGCWTAIATGFLYGVEAFTGDIRSNDFLIENRVR
jgi:hypothetical protein